MKLRCAFAVCAVLQAERTSSTYTLTDTRRGLVTYQTRFEFIVEKDGQVSNVETLTQHKSCPEMDAEAIRVIKMTSGKWIPGLQRNKAVRCSFRLPVRFDLG